MHTLHLGYMSYSTVLGADVEPGWRSPREPLVLVHIFKQVPSPGQLSRVWMVCNGKKQFSMDFICLRVSEATPHFHLHTWIELPHQENNKNINKNDNVAHIFPHQSMPMFA